MKTISMVIIGIVASINFANANAVHLNPDQPANSKTMQTFGRTSIPIGYYEYCRSDPKNCSEPAEPNVVKLSRDRWRQIVEINSSVNTSIKPMTDLQIFGVEEYWTLPEKAGDCEDYALLKRKMLAEQGFPLGSLLMTVGYNRDGGGHAVLTVSTDMGDYILDNLEEKVLLWRDAEITYSKRQSQYNPNTWEDLKRTGS